MEPPELQRSLSSAEAYSNAAAIFGRFAISGSLHFDTLKEVFLKLEPGRWSDAELQSLLETVDVNENGAVELDEWLLWIFGAVGGTSDGGSIARAAFGIAGRKEVAQEKTDGRLRSTRPESVIEASRRKFAEQMNAGKEKRYGAVGERDYELSAYIWDVSAGSAALHENRVRIFGVSELMGVLRGAYTPEEFAKLRFLDLGCGDGQSIFHMHDHYKLPWEQLVGITAEDMRGVEVLDGQQPFDLRKEAGVASDDSYIVWNIDDLDNCPKLHGRCFDVIVSWVTWCWLTDPIGDLELIFDQLLAPGGVLFLGGLQLLTNYLPSAEDEQRAMLAIAHLLQVDGHQILPFTDAANGVYMWWVQRKPSSGDALRLGRYIEYDSKSPIHEDSQKAMYRLTNQELLAPMIALYEGGGGRRQIPNMRLTKGAAEALADISDPVARSQLEKQVNAYRPHTELDVGSKLASWIAVDPCIPGGFTAAAAAARASSSAPAPKAKAKVKQQQQQRSGRKSNSPAPMVSRSGGPKASSPGAPGSARNSSVPHAAVPDGQAQSANATSTSGKAIGAMLAIAVQNLAGDTLLDATVPSNIKVLALKERLTAAQGFHVNLQQLLWQGNEISSGSALADLDIPCEGAVFQLTLRAPPEPTEIEGPRARLQEGITDLKSAKNLQRLIQEVASMQRPPPQCEIMVRAVLHLLAGLEPSIQLKRNGTPKELSWERIKDMLKSKSFISSLKALPDFMGEGKCLQLNIEAAQDTLDSILGATEQEKCAGLARCSLLAQLLCKWAHCILDYYGFVEDIRQRFGDASISDLFPDE